MITASEIGVDLHCHIPVLATAIRWYISSVRRVSQDISCRDSWRGSMLNTLAISQVPISCVYKNIQTELQMPIITIKLWLIW